MAAGLNRIPRRKAQIMHLVVMPEAVTLLSRNPKDLCRMND
jgi:hypothetical protein